MPIRLPRARDGRSAAQIAHQCAHEAGEIARAAFGRSPDVEQKRPGDFVTATDLAIESHVIQIIEAAFPAHAVLSEETRADTNLDGWVWIIDPIDGTTNFTRGIPLFCFNLALALDGVPQLGLTFDPMRREEFLAVRGRGLRLNRRPSLVSEAPVLRDAIVGFGLGYEEMGMQAFETLRRLQGEIQDCRAIGSAALGLAYVACGRLDLFFHNELGGAWDFAPGIVQVEEAGGIITDRSGGVANLQMGSVLAGSPAVHGEFLSRAGEMAWVQRKI